MVNSEDNSLSPLPNTGSSASGRGNSDCPHPKAQLRYVTAVGIKRSGDTHMRCVHCGSVYNNTTYKNKKRVIPCNPNIDSLGSTPCSMSKTKTKKQNKKKWMPKLEYREYSNKDTTK